MSGVGGQVPGYVLGDLLGAGDAARVYSARPVGGGAEVAVRVGRTPLTDAGDRQVFASRLAAARSIAAHPHVVAVRAGGLLDGGPPYVVMDLYRGGSAADALADGGSMPAAQVLDIGFAIADVLVAAHDRGLCHGDLNPAAILFAPDSSPVLAGFELGTSPAAELTVARDVHDLGVTLMALLTGRPAVRLGESPGDGANAVEVSVAGAATDEPAASPVLSVLRRATDPDPRQRYPTAEALRDALAAVRAGRRPGRIRSHPAPPAPPGDGDRRSGRPFDPTERTDPIGPAGTSSPDRPGSEKAVDTRPRPRHPARVAVAVAGLALLVAVVLVLLLNQTG